MCILLVFRDNLALLQAPFQWDRIDTVYEGKNLTKMEFSKLVMGVSHNVETLLAEFLLADYQPTRHFLYGIPRFGYDL